MKALADGVVQEIIDQRRRQKGYRTAGKDEPSAAENAVEGGVIVGTGGDGACREENQAGEEIDDHRMNGNDGGCAGTEVLGDDVHAHEGKPGDENAAVQSDPVQLEQGLVGKQIHTDYADGKESHHRSRDGAE